MENILKEFKAEKDWATKKCFLDLVFYVTGVATFEQTLTRARLDLSSLIRVAKVAYLQKDEIVHQPLS